MTTPEPKDVGLFAAWVVSLALLGGLLLFFTAPLRTRMLSDAVNAVLAEQGDARRLDVPVPAWGAAGRASLIGPRFSTRKSDTAAVAFSVNLHGVGAYFLYFVSPEGKVGDPIPLSDNSRRILERLPSGLRNMYSDRVYASGAWLRERGNQ